LRPKEWKRRLANALEDNANGHPYRDFIGVDIPDHRHKP
jgi:hypothetical protein